MATKKYNLLAYLDKRDKRPGDHAAALADARKIARYLAETHNVTTIGVGSLFDPIKEFTDKSDIDLVLKDIPKGIFFKILAEVESLTSFKVNIIPWENANSLMRETAAVSGILL